MGWAENKLEHIAATVALEGDRTRLQLAAGLAETQRGLRVDGAAYRPLPVAGGLVYGGSRRLVGWTARETGGTNPVSVDLYDGSGPGQVENARLVATFTIPAGGAVSYAAMPAGVSFVEGLFAVVSGTGLLRGSALIGAVD